MITTRRPGLRGLAAAAAAAIPAAILALTPAPDGARAQEFTFKLHHFLSAQAPAHSRMLVPWAEQVEENSGGRVKIEIFPAMTLGGRPPELINQVRDGVVDLVWTVNGYTPGLFPRTEVFELPNVFTNDPRAADLAMNEMLASGALADDYKGVEVMFLHVHAGQAMQMRDKLVRTPADLAGLNIRTPTRTNAWVIEALGATPVAMPVPDLPPALQKGVVDGAFIPFEIIPPLKIQDQTAYQVELADEGRLGTTAFQVSMNQARWDGLPDDIKQAFRDASGPEWQARVGEIWRAADDFGIGLAVKAGNEHVTLTPEESAAFAAALDPVVGRWVEEVKRKGIDGQALVDEARALIEKHAAK